MFARSLLKKAAGKYHVVSRNAVSMQRSSSGPRNFKNDLFAILRAYGEKHNIEFKDLAIRAEFTNNYNFMSDIYLCELGGVQTKDGSFHTYKANYRIKELPVDKAYQKATGCDVAFENEIAAYQKVLPNLKKTMPRPIIIPEFIGSSRQIMVVEDLEAAGYMPVSRKRINVSFAEKMVDILANFHAASLIMKHEEPEKFTEMSRHVKEVNFAEDNPRTSEVFDIQEKWIKVAMMLSGQDIRVRQVLERVVDNLKERTMKVLKEKHDFTVINHGDPTITSNVSNIVANEGTDEVAFSDFQITRMASIAADLSYFMFVSLDPEFYESNKNALLNRYFQQMQSHISKLPCHKDFTMSFLRDEFEKHAVFGFAQALWTTPVIADKVKIEDKIVASLKQFEMESIDKEVENMSEPMKDRIRKIAASYVNTVFPSGTYRP